MDIGGASLLVAGGAWHMHAHMCVGGVVRIWRATNRLVDENTAKQRTQTT